MRILIAGCGYVGIRLAARLHGLGHEVLGMRRNPPADLPYLRWIKGDITNPPVRQLERLDALVLAAGLRRDTEDRYHRLFVEGYQALLGRLGNTNPAIDRVIMVSTTGVFAEENGGWVDESSPVNATSVPGRYYLQAEERVNRCGHPAVIARLSGIYGPERTRLIREVREGRARRFPPPPHYLNHLHADDAAGALAHLLDLPHPDPLYIVSDHEPADRNEVLTWIAGRLGMPDPPLAEADTPRPNRRSGNKRCSPKRLIASGYSFVHPTYREGYEHLHGETR